MIVGDTSREVSGWTRCHVYLPCDCVACPPMKRVAWRVSSATPGVFVCCSRVCPRGSASPVCSIFEINVAPNM